MRRKRMAAALCLVAVTSAGCGPLRAEAEKATSSAPWVAPADGAAVRIVDVGDRYLWLLAGQARHRIDPPRQLGAAEVRDQGLTAHGHRKPDALVLAARSTVALVGYRGTVYALEGTTLHPVEVEKAERSALDAFPDQRDDVLTRLVLKK